jgi:hypothetical protein
VKFVEWVLFALTVHSAKPEKNEVLNSQNIFSFTGNSEV